MWGRGCLFLVVHAAGLEVMPRVSIDLTLPPEARWTQIISERNTTLHKGLNAIKASSRLVSLLLDLAAKVPVGDLRGWMPADQAAEAVSIAALTRVPLSELFVLNALYDISASSAANSEACTSIVTQASDGSIAHGRNLDYSFGSALRELAVTVDWHAGGLNAPPTFTSVGYLGQVAFNTVVRPKGWALSHDERDVGVVLSNWVDLVLKRRILTFSLIRQLAQTVPTFDAAVARAANAPLSAASYFVLSGTQPGEGALITRGRAGRPEAKADIVRLDADARGNHSARWYLLETNYDHDKPPAARDDRRDVATRALARHGQPVTGSAALADVLDVLSDNGHCNRTRGERPVLNAHTVYTAVVSAAHRESLQVVLRSPAAVDNCTS